MTTPTTTDLVAFTRTTPRGITTAEQAEHLQNLLNSAHRAQMTGYGRHGHIVGTIEEVERHRLWVNPFTPADFTPAELAERANSLFRGQQTPIKVVPAKEPGNDDAQEGRAYDLMIIDGRLSYSAAHLKGITRLQVIVVEPPRTMFEVIRDALTAKLSHRSLSDSEAARWMRNLMAMYEVALQQYPDMPKLTQEQLAATVGRDQGYISRLLRLDALPERVQELRELGVLSDAIAVELLPLAGRDATKVADEVGRRVESGAQVTRDDVRELVRHRKVSRPRAASPVLRPDGDIVQPELWITELEETDREMRLAYLMHDLRAALEAETSGRADVSADVQRLLKALSASTLVTYTEQFTK